MAALPEAIINALLDGLAEGVLAVSPDGRIRLVNGAMAQLLGTSRADLVDRTPAELEAGATWIPPVLRRCLETGERQAMILERTGRRLAMTALPLPEGWVLATARDITELDRLERQVERMTLERERYHHELAGLRAVQAGRTEVVGSSLAMQRVMDLIRRVAPVDSTILLLGESGVGKGVLAAEIHRLSPRRGRPLSASTAPLCRRACWSRSCSATRPAPSPAPGGRASPASSSRRTAARSSSTKSATCRLGSR